MIMILLLCFLQLMVVTLHLPTGLTALKLAEEENK